jgi:hypothetical protein
MFLQLPARTDFFSFCNDPQKHVFMFLQLHAKTLSYNPYAMRAVAGVRVEAGGGAQHCPTTHATTAHPTRNRVDLRRENEKCCSFLWP